MKAKVNMKLENVMTTVLNQTIGYDDLKIPRLCNVPSIERLLASNPNISPFILDAYKTRVGFSDNLINPLNTFINYQSNFYRTFDISVFGAYPFIRDWMMLKETMRLAYNKNEQEKYTGISIKNGYRYKTINFEQYKKDKVLKRLQGFAKGFEYGFNTFISTYIESDSAIVANEHFKIQRMLDFLSTTSRANLGFQIIRFSTTVQQGYNQWYEDGINTGYEYHAWYYIFVNHKSFESYFEEQHNKTEHLVGNTIHKKSKITLSLHKDPLDFIDPDFRKLFLEAEKLAVNFDREFPSAIRCAAFCEILYDKKYILQSKTRIKTMVSFAKQRYGRDVAVALTGSKKLGRDKHKNRTVNNMYALKNCFK